MFAFFFIFREANSNYSAMHRIPLNNENQHKMNPKHELMKLIYHVIYKDVLSSSSLKCVNRFFFHEVFPWIRFNRQKMECYIVVSPKALWFTIFIFLLFFEFTNNLLLFLKQWFSIGRYMRKMYFSCTHTSVMITWTSCGFEWNSINIKSAMCCILRISNIITQVHEANEGIYFFLKFFPFVCQILRLVSSSNNERMPVHLHHVNLIYSLITFENH